MPLRGDRLRWPPRLSRRQTGTRQTLSTDEPSASPQQPQQPQQPNERDESSGAQGGAPREVIRQAKRDLDRGLEDTDCRTRTNEVLDDNDRKQR